jgi:hypothetical protein
MFNWSNCMIFCVIYVRSDAFTIVGQCYVFRCAFRHARLGGWCDRDRRCVTLDDIVAINQDQRLEYDVESCCR